ncbi:MAG: 2-nitropropane dioxygenase [Nitrospinales bacterium]
MNSSKIEIVCPCCETKLQVDLKTEEIIWQEKKAKVFSSMSDMVKNLDDQRKEKANLFKKQSALQKDRKRILDEKFKEARKHIDKSDDKPLRDFDLD